MWISKRNSLVLNCLVELYISTKKPVSSLQISKKLKISSSGLRKDLQILESFRFLFKPFSSSGRIPTNKGLKLYLKELKKNVEINKYNDDLIGFEISEEPDFSATSDTILSNLSDNTHNIGFVFLHSIFELAFKRIKFVKISHHKVMVILLSPNKWTFTKIFETMKNYSENDLKKWEITLNTEFKGNDLNTTFKKIRNRQFKDKEKYMSIYKGMFFLLNNKELVKSELLFKGELNVFDSGFIDNNKIKGVLELLKEKEKLCGFLGDVLLNNDDAFTVSFGKDTGLSEFDDLILIASTFYHSDNPIGNIGVIGPRYIHYQDTINKVGNYSAYFSRILSKDIMEA